MMALSNSNYLSNVTVLEIHIKEVSKLFSRMNQKQNYFYDIKARSRFSKLRLNTFPTFNFNKSLSNHSSFMIKLY